VEHCVIRFLQNRPGSDSETVCGAPPGSTSCRTIDTASHRDTGPAAADSRTTSGPAASAGGFCPVGLMMPFRSGLRGMSASALGAET
jgi:hypothetical protein